MPEYNEQRMREIDVPLHKLEERVLQLEGQVYRVDIDAIYKKVISRINLNLKQCLPNLYFDVQRIKKQLEKTASSPDEDKEKHPDH